MRSTIKRRVAAVTALAALAVPAGVAAATPSEGWPTLLGRGALDERLKVNAPNVRAKVKPSDLAVAEVAIAPGGTSGWHIHPGPSMSIVTEGTVTWYEGEDPACTPRSTRPASPSPTAAPTTSISFATRPTSRPRSWSRSSSPRALPPSSTPPTPATARSEPEVVDEHAGNGGACHLRLNGGYWSVTRTTA